MKKVFFLLSLLFLISSVSSVASEIKRISLSELLTKADLVVMGEVTIDLYTSLDKWRAYRVQCKQIRNIEEYERGFRKGFDGPPGLVDGSADFNLGHSDGMISKMKKFPNQQDAGDCK